MGVPWSGFCSRSRCSLRILLAKLRFSYDICQFLFRNDSKLPCICIWMGTEGFVISVSREGLSACRGSACDACVD